MQDEPISEDGIGTNKGGAETTLSGTWASKCNRGQSTCGSTSSVTPQTSCSSARNEEQEVKDLKEVGFNGECTTIQAQTLSQKNKVAKSASLDHDTPMIRVEAETTPNHQQQSQFATCSSQEPNAKSFQTSSGRPSRPPGGYHGRSSSMGTTVRFEDSMEDINSKWKCFPEVSTIFD